MSGRLLLDPATGLPVLIGGQLLAMPQGSAPPTVAVLSASPVISVLEGETAVLRVAVDPPMGDDALTFDYATEAGTALAGTDFAAITSAGTIPAGQSYVDLPIPTISRVGTNGSRSFTVVISNAQAGARPVTTTNDTATITIADVGAGVVLPALGFDPVTAQDEGTSIVFTVKATKTHSANVSFTYTTVDGTAVAGVDYTTQAGSGAITIGQDSFDITVPTATRAGYQGARSLSVLISAASDGTDTIEIHTSSATGLIRETEAPTGENGYFDAFIADPNYYTGFSMRPVVGQPQFYPTGHPHAGKRNPYYEHQLKVTSQGGFANLGSGTITRYAYSPATDTHAQAQDAMRTMIPAWSRDYTLKTALTAEATSIHINADLYDPPWLDFGSGMIVDDEILTINSVGNATGQVTDGAGGRTIQVLRGQSGTVAASHPTTSFAKVATNSLWPQWRPPVGTANGYAYFFVWDFFITDDYRPAPLEAYKCFQFSSTTGSNWLEMQTRFNVGTAYQPPTYHRDTHIGVATWRTYGAFTDESDWATANSGKSGDLGRRQWKQGIFNGLSQPISPMLNSVPSTALNGGFLLYSGRWTRCCMLYKQNVNDWDDMTIWMSDEVQEPRQELHAMKMSIDGGVGGSIQKFWVELNTSKTEFTRPWVGTYASPALLPPLTMYHKNFGAQRVALPATIADFSDWLVKPEAGA